MQNKSKFFFSLILTKAELCALTWEDISLESNTIRIHRTMQRIQTSNALNKTKILISEPKSQCSIREIPVAESLRNFLELYHDKIGYVLTGKCNKYVEPRTLQNHFKAILKTCEISNASFHTLRHTFATRCIGIIGGIVGSISLGIFGLYGSGIIGNIIVSVIGACILIAIGRAIKK